jgi:hypothetical protein
MRTAIRVYLLNPSTRYGIIFIIYRAVTKNLFNNPMRFLSLLLRLLSGGETRNFYVRGKC